MPVGEQLAILSASHLRKIYGTVTAVDDISFEVRPGEIVGLLGPNGAGKTTTINMILGVLEPSAGRILIGGKDILRHRSDVLSRTNFAAVYAPLPGNLTVVQNLKIFGLFYSVKNLSARIEELLIEFELVDFRNTKCGVLSSGEQTRVGLAKAIINEPQLLLLDEPTSSLDPAKASEVRELIRNYATKYSIGVLWTSHNMYEVEHVCDRVMFLSKGKVLLEGDPRTLPSEYHQKSLEELFITVAREPLTLTHN